MLGAPAEWRPLRERELGANATENTSRGRAAGGDRDRDDEGDGERRQARARAGIEARARQLGLQPLRWPEPFPFDSSFAMRACAYAASIGRCVPFAQAAFRQAFAGGHSLEDPDFVLIAAAACEMHPNAVLRGARLRSTAARLSANAAAAAAAGVHALPALTVGARAFCGEDAPERAATHVRAPTGAAPAPSP